MMKTEIKLLLAQKELKNKTRLYILHVLFGWSYGSLGKAGLQALFYVISSIGWFAFWTILAGMAEAESIVNLLVGVLIMFFITQAWWIIRLALLSGKVNKYNREICLRYSLTKEEMVTLGVDP